MGYSLPRIDGRKSFEEMRPVEAKVGVIPRADGSAMFKMGKTTAYAAVYGPRELHPRSMQNPERGILRCKYNMLPWSGMGERVRPGPNRRAKEISHITEKALMPVVDLDDYPKAVVDVFIDLPETDAGSRCAGICAASMALADAGIAMKDLVGALAIGRVDDKLVIDLDYAEEAYDGGPVADTPIAYIPALDKFSLLQMDGEITKEMLIEGLDKGKDACQELIELQREALKKKFEGENNASDTE